MCVEVKAGTKVHRKVIAYKLFQRDGRHIRSLYVSSGGYQRGVIYRAKTAHGFQAFMHKRDALRAFGESGYKEKLLRVELFRANQGVIAGMSSLANGFPGWTARAMRIPKRRTHAAKTR